MKKIIFKFLTLLVVSSLLVVACSSDSKKKGTTGPGIVNPEDYDWTLVVEYDFVSISNFFDIRNNEVSLSIDGESVDLSYSGFGGFGLWYANYSFTQGTEYNFALTVDGTTTTEDLKIVYRAYDESFPESWNPSVEANVSWSLDSDNLKQVAVAASYYYDYNNWNYVEDEYYQEIEPSARQYTFPAGCVQSYGEDTDYELEIIQMNQKASNKILFLSIHSLYRDYWGDDWDRNNEERVMRKHKLIRSIF